MLFRLFSVFSGVRPKEKWEVNFQEGRSCRRVCSGINRWRQAGKTGKGRRDPDRPGNEMQKSVARYIVYHRDGLCYSFIRCRKSIKLRYTKKFKRLLISIKPCASLRCLSELRGLHSPIPPCLSAERSSCPVATSRDNISTSRIRSDSAYRGV